MKKTLGIAFAALLCSGIAVPAQATGGGYGHTPITICHNGHTITVDDDAVQKHLDNHGDYLGECVAPAPTQSPTPTEEPTSTPTPTPTPTPQPTTSPEPSESPSPSSSPTETPTPTTTMPSSGATTQPMPLPVSSDSTPAEPSQSTSAVPMRELAATGPAQVVFLLVTSLGLIGLGFLIKRKVA